MAASVMMNGVLTNWVPYSIFSCTANPSPSICTALLQILNSAAKKRCISGNVNGSGVGGWGGGCVFTIIVRVGYFLKNLAGDVIGGTMPGPEPEVFNENNWNFQEVIWRHLKPIL